MSDSNAPYLLAALSYAADMNTDGCYYHSWRMALVAKQLASVLAPESVQDVFYGALVQDLGGIGARHHIYRTPPSRNRIIDRCIANHAVVSSSMLNWLPGMQKAAEYVRSHHTWWRGRRGNDGSYGASLPGTQILSLVDAASRAGCFSSPRRMGDGLRSIAWQANNAWKLEVWQALVQSTRDAAFYRRVASPEELPSMIKEAITQVGIPEALLSSKGVDRVLHMFAVALDLKEPSACGHSMRVAGMARVVAKEMGLPLEQMELVYRAGLVHDCGKLGIPMSLLGKPGRYLTKDLNEIKSHAAMTIRSLTCLPGEEWLRELADIAGHDHERMDGQGYPHRMKGERIPKLSRILAVVDAYDAMAAPSDYRIITPRAALLRINEGSGSQFDPDVVEAVTAIVAAGKYSSFRGRAA